MKRILFSFFMPLVFMSALSCSRECFVRVEDGLFVSENAPLYFIGTNFWYGPLLASDSAAGNMDRLCKELDSLKQLGLTNLRVLVGGDGISDEMTKIKPALQTSPGKYDESVFKGLDRFLAEIGKRDMKAVLYLNNTWEWSGGFGQYLEWAGAGDVVMPDQGWDKFRAYTSGFVTNEKAKKMAADHIRAVVTRVNTVTGKPYAEDSAIFAWQIANEPRCFSASEDVRDAFVEWIWETAALIKSLDSNHMVSTGNEGTAGCEESMELYERLHTCPDIDYMTIHIWPYNWSWVRKDSLAEDLDKAIEKTGRYIDAHLEVAEKYGKPVVLEEFGFPRDGFLFTKESPVTARDKYYSYVFDRLVESKSEGGLLAGVNFWAWGGMACQVEGRSYWQEGDDYCGDPAQEQQGLNSVYISDNSTINIIKNAQSLLNASSGLHVKPVLENDWIYTDESGIRLRVAVRSSSLEGGDVRLCLLKDTGDTVTVENVRFSEGKYSDTLSFRIDAVPGFYKVELSACSNGTVTSSETFNVGCSPEKIVSSADKQPDFDDFWNRSMKMLAEVSPEYRFEFLPEHSDSIRRTYRVEMKSFGGVKVSGIYIEPVKPGKYPAYITYMGYGSEPWYNDPSARPEAVEFTLSIRNQALNRLPGEKDDWVVRGLEGGKDTYYYRGAFMDVIRAIDFVCSREKTDTSRVFAEGGSQGGALTLVAASLDKRIRAVAPFVPFLSDFPDYFKIANWPAYPVLQEARRLDITDEELYRILSYFDIKNFTDKIACPVLMGFGLQDSVCPPHTNFAGYNRITSSKRYVTFPYAGHQVEREARWWAERDAFFKEFENQNKQY